ncbi:uncharacterized protein LOC106520812, partial [Austrofundulus limnaeus]|uniref:Uncharacterized protein LOC106520812 n=1 Tax=Austrofundulus limnaeus TaxID=52670 RepID=A0A2I4BLA6_AUSLI
MQVLSKGLTFSPTTGPDLCEVKSDLYKFYRNLNLKMWFSENNSNVTTNEPNVQFFKPKSTFHPVNNNASLIAFKRKTNYDIEKLISDETQRGTYHHNLTREERKAIKELNDNKTIIIKPADKGGAVVVWDRNEYIREAQRQLNDPKNYKKLSINPTLQFMEEFYQILENATKTGVINDTTFKFLYNKNPVTPTLYLLPKIHKGKGTAPPGRPIVSANNSILENTCSYIDHYLHPLVVALPSYIKDSTSVLNIMNKFKQEDFDFFISMDVESLYTNIAHVPGIEAVRFFLENNDMTTDEIEFLLLLIEWSLTHNFFTFNGEYYLQLCGVSMGSKYAPQFACLFMGWWESKFIHNNNPFINHLKYYGRYIDDILILFKGTESDLLAFYDYINNT